MYLPTSPAELKNPGWDQLDVVIVTGDTYIDSPYIGAAIIGKVLAKEGFRVGIIAQPDIDNGADITRLGEPRLFWGVTSGSVDSMVANYTASKKHRRQDDFTPGGLNNRRPDRADIVYSNLIRRYFKNTRPIVLGGIEASLRRVAHYDFWSDSLRRSILLDAKADYLIYGMGELAVVELARKLRDGEKIEDIRGVCYVAPEPRPGYLVLPSFETVKKDPNQFIKMFDAFYQNSDPISAAGLCQEQDSGPHPRYLIQNPPARLLSTAELDAIHAIDFERNIHPYYRSGGPVRALDTIKFSIATHRGCYGECNFCSIAVHQGRTIQSRSEDSVVDEAELLTKLPDFKGYILDVGGPTANMYGGDCPSKIKKGACPKKRCLFPEVCPSLPMQHQKQIRLLERIRRIPGVKKVFVASGIRYDLILRDQKQGQAYLRGLVRHYISGQLKIAPEHSEDRILSLMGKPPRRQLQSFQEMFNRFNRESGKPQFLTYYLIAAHPGCEERDMHRLREFTTRELRLNPEQVQIYTPLPSTYSALMYYTGINPFTGKPLYVEKDIAKKEHQKQAVIGKPVRKRKPSIQST